MFWAVLKKTNQKIHTLVYLYGPLKQHSFDHPEVDRTIGLDEKSQNPDTILAFGISSSLENSRIREMAQDRTL